MTFNTNNTTIWHRFILLVFAMGLISGCGTLEISATSQSDDAAIHDDGAGDDDAQDDVNDDDIVPEDDTIPDDEDDHGQTDDQGFEELAVTNASLHIKKYPIGGTCKTRVKITSTFVANRKGKIHFKLHRSHKPDSPLDLVAPTKMSGGKWLAKHTRTLTLSGPLDRTYEISVKNPNGQLLKPNAATLSLECNNAAPSRTNPATKNNPVRTNPKFKITSASVDLIKFPPPSSNKMCPRKVMIRTTFTTNMKGPGKVRFKQHRSNKPGNPLSLTAPIKKIAGKWQAVHERIITVKKSVNRSFMVESSNPVANTKASPWKKLKIRCNGGFSAGNNLKNN